jgi:hypothetical protein
MGGPPPGGGGGISGKVIAIIVAAVLVLAGGGVAAAVLLTGDDDGGGGGNADDAPDSASVEDFCDGLNAFDEEIGDDLSDEEKVDQAHELADELSEIGTPDDISDDAREGFELYLKAISEVDADDIGQFESAASEEELREALGLSEDEYAKVTAFFTYTGEKCFDVPTDVPTDIPTDDLPTDLPTDIPTDLPTDFSFPTDFSLPTDFSFPTDFTIPTDFTFPTE